MEDSAMAESSNLMLESMAILATPNHEGLAAVVNLLFINQETSEHQKARALFDFCVANFPNCLTLMLLKVYRYSSDNVVRFRSLDLLYETLSDLRNGSFEFSLVALYEIKPFLVSCLTIPKSKRSHTKILGRIVSFVAFDVLKFDNGGWDELGDCILLLVNSDPLRAFNVFVHLPPIYEELINRFLHKLLEEVHELLLNPVEDGDDDWALALATAMKLGIQLLGLEMRLDLTREILGIVLKSADKLVMKGEEQFLQRGLINLEKFLAQDSKMYRYSSKQCGFVSEFAISIARIGTHTDEAAIKIYQMVTKLENYVFDTAFKLSSSVPEYHGPNIDLYNNLKILSAVEILRLVALTEMDNRCREIAVRRLHDLLCDHASGKAEIDVSEMRELQTLLISCLTEEGVPESTFKILGQVVFYVAYEMFSYQGDKWFELWDFIASECRTHFKETVYIFQCLTMMLGDKQFVIPAIENLLPEISKRLNPPKELLVDNSCWVLAFVGAFCAAIHLLGITSHVETVTEIAHKMVDSVGELVERGGIEVGLVGRAFKDLESIVKKQLEWYDITEHRFVKALFSKLNTIKGQGFESKAVLVRLIATLDRETKELAESF